MFGKKTDYSKKCCCIKGHEVGLKIIINRGDFKNCSSPGAYIPDIKWEGLCSQCRSVVRSSERCGALVSEIIYNLSLEIIKLEKENNALKIVNIELDKKIGWHKDETDYEERCGAFKEENQKLREALEKAKTALAPLSSQISLCNLPEYMERGQKAIALIDEALK